MQTLNAYFTTSTIPFSTLKLEEITGKMEMRRN
jgi:hypothetical protein